MKLTPIPRCVLSESVYVRVPVDDDYGMAWSDERKPLYNVRIESAQSMTNKGFVLSDGCKAVMFVDAVNSIGFRDIPQGSLIGRNGEELNAYSVTPCEACGVIHHWEVELR